MTKGVCKYEKKRLAQACMTMVMGPKKAETIKSKDFKEGGDIVFYSSQWAYRGQRGVRKGAGNGTGSRSLQKVARLAFFGV